MKKLLLIIVAAFSMNAYAQTSTPEPKAKSLDCYAAGSLSMSTGNDFKMSSYPSLELGISRGNTAFGFNSGRSNLGKSPYAGENIKNYYGEAKVMVYFPIGSIKGYVIGGLGAYYNSNHSFIEYGGGVVRSVGKIDLMLQVSNWDQIVYLSPGIAYNFSIK